MNTPSASATSASATSAGNNVLASELARALDPERSCAVEACAGSGKTWLLVSRILRLLLAGAAPGSILALTFTRKAAQEMRARLDGWLHDLALCADQEALDFLRQRGLTADQARAALPRARGLYETVLTAQPGVAIDTFHGWFMRGIALAPLSPPGALPSAGQRAGQSAGQYAGSVASGATLIDTPVALLSEAWQYFAVELGRQPAGAHAQAFVRVLAEIGLSNTRTLLFSFANRRSEWWAFTAGADQPAEFADHQLRTQLGVHEEDDPVGELLAQQRGEMAEFALLLGRGTPTEQSHAAILSLALQSENADESWLHKVREVWLIKTGEARKRRASAAQQKRLGADGEARYLALHESLSGTVQDTEAALLERHICDFNRDAFVLGAAFIATYQGMKAARNAIDFNDIEWQAASLLTDSDHAAYLHERLDARIKHLLLDEFQDTNPLQWAALRGWLDAYGDDGARPTVLLVGDPKQSIYRFRRADVRLFDAAQTWLQQTWDAAVVQQNRTRRNAPAIVDAVNQLFGSLPDYPHFVPQTTSRTGLPGRVELLPLIAKPADEARSETARETPQHGALRNPLLDARAEQRDQRSLEEGRQIAQRIVSLVDAMCVVEEKNGTHRERLAGYGDIKILARKKSALAGIEAALRELGIPYLTARGGGLLDTLEASDLVALLTFLVSPGNDLALAHALKSPVFGVSDDDLIWLARAENAEKSWWERLLSLSPAAPVVPALPASPASPASPALVRAGELLSRWLPQADALPVHDLLDRVYHEADVHARYAAAAPAHLAASVAANLDAFIALALEVDHGRFPSLPRFIDELKSARRGADEEAPDQGIAGSADDAGGNAVQLMTVHGAKGLEAPIVFLSDAHARDPRERGYEPLIEWPPDAAAPAHFSVLTTTSDIGRGRLAIVDAARASAHTEERNLLYVAMTRAAQLLVVSGRETSASNDESAYRLIETAVRTLHGTEAGEAAPPAYGELAMQAVEVPPKERLAPSETGLKPAPTKGFPDIASPARGSAPVGVRRAAPTPPMRSGILVHALLQLLSGHRDVQPAPAVAAEAINAVARQLGACAAEAAAAHAQAAAVLAAPQFARWFDPAQFVKAHNELEVLAGSVLQRLDRLVEFDTEVWVLDYKARVTDGERGVYLAQLAGYAATVRPLYPGKAVKAALIDLAELTIVNPP